MENNKGINFFFLIVVIILGRALVKQFDFDTFKFEKPALATLYIVIIVATTYYSIKGIKKQPEK